MIVKFIKSLLFFLFPLLFVLVSMEYCLSKVENIYSLKRKMIERQSDSLQVLILGTSQTFHSLNPALFKSPALNVAAPVQPLFYDCQIVAKYLPRLRNLKVVILPLDYFSLFFDIDSDSSRTLYYYHFWKISHPLMASADIRKYSLMALFKPATSRDIFLQMITEKKLSIRFQTFGMLENGFEGEPPPTDTVGFEKKALMKIIHWNDSLMSENNFAGNTQRIEHMVQILAKENIKVLFISTPVIKNLFEKYDSGYNRLNLNFIRSVTARYSNTTFADFSQDPRFTITDFFDPNHLDSAGAVKFSKIINDEYINKMIH